MRRSSAESRQAIIESTADLLTDLGASALNVNAIMERAGISRTIFYRQFSEVYEVVEALIEQLVTHMAARSGAWLREAGAVGTPDQIYPNLIGSAAAIQPYAPLVLALHGATGIDERLRRIWP